MSAVTTEAIRELRERLGIGMQEARDTLVARDLRERVSTNHEMVLLTLINKIYPKDPDDDQ